MAVERDDATAEAGRMLRGYSVEVLAGAKQADQLCRDHLPPGTETYVAFVPGEAHARLVETAAKLTRAGFRPVPHIVARSLADRRALEDLLARLSGEAGVAQALVLGGDVDRPAGAFSAGLDLVETGLFERFGFRRLGFATYPERHPKIAEDRLATALRSKLARAAEVGIEPWLVTQFCFEPRPILDHLRRLRADGVAVPVRIGLAGPADRRTLLKYALHCGVGNSMRALGTRADLVGRLMAREAPDALLAALAAGGQAADGIHIFTFGGLAGAADWANRLIEAAGAA